MSRGRPSRKVREAERALAEQARADREAAEKAQVVTQRAIRRLDMLEWVIFGVGALLAMGGGAIFAAILTAAAGWDFRSTWIGASLLLFVVPGVVALAKIRKDERSGPGTGKGAEGTGDG